MSGERGTASRGGSSLILALVVGVSSGVAAALALRLVESEPAKAEPVGNKLASSADSAELAALREEIAALRRDIGQWRLPEGSAAAAATPAPTSLAPEAQLAALAAAIDGLQKRLDAALPATISGPPQPEKMKALEPWTHTDRSPPRESWFLWTEGQVLEAYGPPSGAATNTTGPYWSYDFDDGGYVEFFFGGGRVVKTSVERPPKPR